MKKISTLFILVISVLTARAQNEEKTALYLGAELNIGNYFGVDFNVNYLHLEKYSLRLGYSGNIRKPKSMPPDYNSGFLGALAFGLANPFDQFQSYQLAAGRIYKLNKGGTLRANLSLGIGYTIIREPGNWQSNDGFITENYSWNYSDYNTMSLIINPKIEFPFNRYYGLSFSPMLQISKDRIYWGVGIGQIMGLLRKKKEQVEIED